jgi:hypothetical protein
MISRVDDYLKVRQRDEEASRSSSTLLATQDATAQRLSSVCGTEHQTPFTFETSALDGTEHFSLELEDLWNMVVSSDARMTQDFVTDGEPTAMYSADHSAT